MRRFMMTSILCLPLFLGASQAAQNISADSPGRSWVFSSEDGGTSAYLGVDISDVTTERLSDLKLKEEKGVEVTMVDQDAPAGKAGIKEHDVILTMNGEMIESKAQLQRMIHETPPGRIITLGLSRDGQPLTLKVQLADKHKEFAMAGPDMKNFHVAIPEIHIPDIDMPAINMVMTTSSARSGLMVENITPQLGEFFGVKNGNGVLVRSVEKGSRAEKAGLRAGDVIVKINEQPVHDTSDFAHAVRTRNGGSVSVGVIRDRKEQNLNMTLPDRKQSGALMEEESSDSAIDADSAVEWSDLRQEVARLQPEMELAAEDAGASAREIQKNLRKELNKELCAQREHLRDQAEQLKNEIQVLQEQFKKDQEKLKIQLEHLPSELRGRGLDI